MATPLQVTYLLAVWGKKYIDQFMDLSLRTLLAPGNIPGLSAHANSCFTFLTRDTDRAEISAHPLFATLASHCRIEFIAIDDLIFERNYSATLTIAYDRGMRAAGPAMCSTYFIYLVADYVMADGSLKNLLPYLQQNVSAITAGNYQVVEETMQRMFEQRIDPKTGLLVIPPRELVALTLPNLHPLTLANTVNLHTSHTSHTNRLFWRADDQTLIGRFYLRHMLAIKPEIDNYIIGASCDYSFVAEMCPSGKVANISDSDEYCVIEMQPFAHERNFIRPGPLKPDAIAAELANWATSYHRHNIETPVIFHAGDLSPQAKELVEQSARYVRDIESIHAAPHPVRGHPYWLSCMEGVLGMIASEGHLQRRWREGTLAGLLGSKTFEPVIGKSVADYHLLKTNRFRYRPPLRHRIFRAMRQVTGGESSSRWWHRERAHAQAIKAALAEVAARDPHFLFIAFKPTSYVDWLHAQHPHAVVQHADLFVIRPDVPHAKEAVILLPRTKIGRLPQLLAKCDSVLSGSKNVTIILTQRVFYRNRHFTRELQRLAALLPSAHITTITNPLRHRLDMRHQRDATHILRRGRSPVLHLKRILPLIRIPFIATLYAWGNKMSTIRNWPHEGHPTCAILTLQLEKKP